MSNNKTIFGQELPDPPFVKRCEIKKGSSSTGMQFKLGGFSDHPETAPFRKILVDSIKTENKRLGGNAVRFVNQKGKKGYKPAVFKEDITNKTAFQRGAMKLARSQARIFYEGRYNPEWIDLVLTDEWNIFKWVLLTNSEESYKKKKENGSFVNASGRKYAHVSFALLTTGVDPIEVENIGW